jgi:hypothetical protein
MRLYDSTLPDGGRRLIVHLDESRVIEPDDPRLDTDGFPGVGDPDPEWCLERVFGFSPELPETGTSTRPPGPNAPLPMRKMTREEIAEQQEAEIVALAREALAARRAAEDQAMAAAADPFAGGGRRIKEN